MTGMRRYVLAEGWEPGAFKFALDPTPAQLRSIFRHFGARRFAYNWAVEVLREEREAYKKTGVGGEGPSLGRLRRLWNSVKDGVAVGREDSLPWWQEASKEAFSSGIKDAVDGYWNWMDSVTGKRAGRRVGFPSFKKRGSDLDRYRITTGSFGASDNRHVKIPRVGRVRVQENMRRFTRLVLKGRLKLRSATVKQEGDRCFVVFQVDVKRWPVKSPECTHLRVGVDLGVRRLATVASEDGRILEAAPNPGALERGLAKLWWLYHERSRCTSRNSVRYRERTEQIAREQRRIANVRRNSIHALTTRLAKTHGEMVVEGMNVAGLMRQRGLPGVRKRRRDLADASMGEVRRQLRYKVAWRGGKLVEADPYYPSTKLCSGCGALGTPGWSEWWACGMCGERHQRDDNAAVNLARYREVAA